MNDLIAFLTILSSLGLLVVLVSFAQKRLHFSAEFSRKIIHIFMGAICMSFPWIFQHVISVQILGIAAAIALALLRSKKLKIKIASALFSVERSSIGELLFPLSVVWLFTIAHQSPILYLISLLLLTFADAFSALVGTKYGQLHYKTLSGNKTLEGSLTFFCVAFFCCFIPLFLSTEYSLIQILLISLTVSLISTFLEGIASHGLDNLLIPIATYLALDYYLSQSYLDLWSRIIALLVLSALLIISRRNTTLDGSGLMGGILFTFAAFSIGSFPCLISVFFLFARHVLITRR